MTNQSAQILVFGNEKGGTGKSTLAMHVVISLLESGHSVFVIDLDARQKSISRYLLNRQSFMQTGGANLPMCGFVTLEPSSADNIQDREKQEQIRFEQVLSSVRSEMDFIVIDCPGNHTYLSKLAHALADTLVTPLNDSFVDLDLLGEVSPVSYQVKRISHYSELVWESRKFRSASGLPAMNWLVTRNRLAPLDSHNNKRVHAALDALQHRIKFRYVPGLNERVIYRELFPQGLTVLDLGKLNSASHQAARKEVNALVDQLQLCTQQSVIQKNCRPSHTLNSSRSVARQKTNLDILFE